MLHTLSLLYTAKNISEKQGTNYDLSFIGVRRFARHFSELRWPAGAAP